MSDSTIYACHRCGEFGIKLWREAQTFNIRLTCVNCLEVIEAGGDHAFDVVDISGDGTRMSRHGQTDQIGWWLPAVQVLADLPDLVFWGYTSSPPEDYAAWAALPLHPQPEPGALGTSTLVTEIPEGSLVIDSLTAVQDGLLKQALEMERHDASTP